MFLYNFLKKNYKLFLKHTLVAMGSLSTVTTIFVSLFPILNCPCVWMVCLLTALCFGISSIIPSKNITVTFIRRRDIKIKQGDLFSTPLGSIVIIPVNNYLDTQLEHDVVGENTIHGRFIKYFKQQYPDKNLDQEIQKAIQNDNIVAVGSTNVRLNVQNNKFEKYALGTIVRIKCLDRQYYLVVATEFDENNHVIYQAEKFTLMIMRMLSNINTYNSGHPVYMPIIGSGQTGLNLSKEKTLCHILHCFNLADHYVTTGGTTIVVHESDMKQVSLNKVKDEINDWLDE